MGVGVAPLGGTLARNYPVMQKRSISSGRIYSNFPLVHSIQGFYIFHRAGKRETIERETIF